MKEEKTMTIWEVQKYGIVLHDFEQIFGDEHV